MSRSYKKTPYCGLHKDKSMKRYANRKLRRKSLTSNLQYKSYRKDLCSYRICDYYDVGTTFENYWFQVKRRWYDCYAPYGYPYPDKDKEYQYWMSHYIRK